MTGNDLRCPRCGACDWLMYVSFGGWESWTLRPDRGAWVLRDEQVADVERNIECGGCGYDARAADRPDMLLRVLDELPEDVTPAMAPTRAG